MWQLETCLSITFKLHCSILTHFDQGKSASFNHEPQHTCSGSWFNQGGLLGLIQIHGILIGTLNSRIIWIFKQHLTTTELSTQWKEIAKLLPLKRIFQKIPILHSTENGTRSRWKPPTKNVKILCQSRLLLGFVVEKLDFFIHSQK